MAEAKEAKRSYKKTLNLPRTTFPMRANLVQKEPGSQKRWDKADLYQQVRETRRGAPRFIFHDGPPYANGPIHLGHLLNKVLKDFVVRATSMAGFDTPYVPGWDCHGLPIEHKVMQEQTQRTGESSTPTQSEDDATHTLAVRRACRKYAQKYVKLQSRQMQRLLTLADYNEPYLTMAPAYEAAVLEVFAKLVERGLVYRGLKPVHWSIENRTALAEAELEYHDRTDPSVYVGFRIDPGSWTDKHEPMPARLSADADTRLIVWTTTPWTLPANLAVAVHPEAEYGLYNVRREGELLSLLIAEDLAPHVLKIIGVEKPIPDESIARFTGRQLVGLRYRHPFLDHGATRRIVAADYVTLEDGTGMVHTAPGHGVEDYQTGLREGLDIYCPVHDDGTFDDTAPQWLRGKGVWEANDLIVERLRESGALLHTQPVTHSYPHDWRGKTPVIFRATEQWFVAVDKPLPPPLSPDFAGGSTGEDAAGSAEGGEDGSAEESPTNLAGEEGEDSLRQRALAAIEDVRFIPTWGRNRMRGMLESRPDWCISRQRAWGLPIPAFHPPLNTQGPALLTAASVRAVAATIAEHGSDAWFTLCADDLLSTYDPEADPEAPEWIKPENRRPQHPIRKSTDIFDVWFESGSSWHACLAQRFGSDATPADLYLEGSDQHRGWFQLSLLPAVGALGQSPFNAVLTHGHIVDRDGRKMSKSQGNTLDVEELLSQYGADVCRWWISSLSVENDIKVDASYFEVAGDQYRKVRNTIRFLLSNLHDFNTNPTAEGDRHLFTLDDEMSLDAWALGRLDDLIEQVKSGYATFTFRKVHELLYNFCNDTMSATYLAAIKDRLYCDPPDSLRRRRSQTAILRIADALIRLLAPILPHTADEAWAALYGEAVADADASGDGLGSVHLVEFPEPTRGAAGADRHMPVYEGWPQIMAERDRALKRIEEARETRQIDNPLDMGLRITFDPKAQHFYEKLSPVDFADLLGVSRVALNAGARKPSDAAWADASAAKMEVLDLRSEPRCERSWKRDGTVREREDGSWLCDRDAAALQLE